MNLSNETIRARWQRLLNFFKNYWLVAVIFILAGLFVIQQAQRYLDRRAIENQNESLKNYDAEREKSAAQTQALINGFEQQHQNTLQILSLVKAQDNTISKLVESDARQDQALKDVKENYNNAKNQNSQNNDISRMRAARRLQPVRKREENVLSTDSELYPSAANGN